MIIKDGGNMKKKQQMFILIGLGIILLGVVGFFGYRYYVGQKNNVATVTPATTKSTTAVNQLNADQKTDNTPTAAATPVQTKPSTTTTPVADNLGILSDASLTAYLYAQSSVASDGTTPMPASSVAPFFYVPSGSYTIQKLSNGVWTDLITNQSYPGHGGIAAWFFGPTEDNVSYRVLKIESGKPVSASKTFVVKRADLTGGVHTYN
jgi:hypothetical protein